VCLVLPPVPQDNIQLAIDQQIMWIRAVIQGHEATLIPTNIPFNYKQNIYILTSQNRNYLSVQQQTGLSTPTHGTFYTTELSFV
jgi:hypothetical protein